MRSALALFTLLLVLPAFAAESKAKSEKERLADVAAEVARRRTLRENAQRVIREHESGEKLATEADLAAARAVLAPPPARPAEGASVNLPDADMATVATTWRVLFKEELTISEAAKSRGVNIKLADPSLEGLRTKLEAALARHGLYLVRSPDSLLLDTRPALSYDGTGYTVSLPGTDLQAVVRLWWMVSNEVLTVGERAKGKRVEIKISAPSREELQKKFGAALREHGIYITPKLVLDTEPDAGRGK